MLLSGSFYSPVHRTSLNDALLLKEKIYYNLLLQLLLKTLLVVNLDTCPPPLTITLPDRKKDSFVLKINGSKTVILPPEIKPADFSVLMQNYNTDQGLPLSDVHSSCMDKYGNLWFATYGGGEPL